MYLAPSYVCPQERGVFAARHYRRGEWLCHFDGKVQDSINKEEQQYSLYCEGVTQVGLPTARCCLGIAQLINDGCKPIFSHGRGDLYERVRTTCLDLFAYIKLSLERENVFTFDGINFYAQRDLAQGEECYFSYGPNFWCSYERMRTQDPYLFSTLCYVCYYVTKRLDKGQKDIMRIICRLYLKKREKIVPKPYRMVEMNLYAFDSYILILARQALAKPNRENLVINFG